MFDSLNSPNKTKIRKEIIEKLINYENKKEVSLLLLDKLEKEIDLDSFDYILSYYPLLKTEVDIRPLFSRKNILLPYIENNEMDFAPIENLKKNSYGFYEPRHNKINYQKALILVPSLALDKENYRLGRGAGFYDRYINKNKDKLFTVSLVFPISIIDDFNKEKHDIKIQKVITI